MRSSTLPLLLTLLLSVDAVRIPFTQRKRPSKLAADCSDSTCGSLGDIQDSVYVSNITVGGVDFEVLLDTGSSDLWVNASLHPIPNAQLLNNVIVSEVYGDGSNYTGPVGFAPVTFHGFSVANQSYTNAIHAENDNTAQLNVTGLIGLSFDGLSEIQGQVQQATGSATAGQTFLSNVFAANPSQPNFISFWLSRTADINSTENQGAFTISEVEQGFDAVTSQTKVPLISNDDVEWSVALDSLAVGGKSVSLGPSLVQGSTKNVVLLDTGTSNILIDPDIVENIYGSVSGAQKVSQGGGSTLWVLPCNTVPPTVAFTIGGQSIPIHPLDVNSLLGTFQTNTGSLVSVCAGGIIGSTGSANRFDMLLGSPFIRNAYTTFNFASNSSSTSFVQLLAITDPSTANSDFTSTRSAQLKLAPEASSSQLQQILDGNFPEVNNPPLSGGGSGSSGSGSSGGSGSKGGAAGLKVEGTVVLAVSLILATAFW